MTELARRAGINVGTVSRWERGLTQPCIPELTAFLRTVGASEDERLYALSLIEAPRAKRHLLRATESQLDRSLAPSPGNYIRALRLRSRMSQAELSHRVGIAQSTIVRWERGDLWPSQHSLELLLTTLQALPAEREALLFHPERLSPVPSVDKITYEFAEAWLHDLIRRIFARETEDLIELQFHELIASLSHQYPRWHDRGTRLMSLALGRLGQWYLGAECGATEATAFYRPADAVRYARQAIRTEPQAMGALLGVLTISRSTRYQRPKARKLQITELERWASLPLIHEEDSFAEGISYRMCAWVMSEQAAHLEELGYSTDAIARGKEAIVNAVRSNHGVEPEMRTFDVIDRYLRREQFDDAAAFFQPTSTGILDLDLWEKTQHAEILLGQGHKSRAGDGLEESMLTAQRIGLKGLSDRMRRVMSRL